MSRRLCFALDLINDYPRDVQAEPTQVQNDRWETYMMTFQRLLPELAEGEKWAPMRRVFLLADHEGRVRS